MNPVQEQLSIYKILLKATQDLAQGKSPEEILQSACDALVAASNNITLAWTYLGNPETEDIRPGYAVGRSVDYTNSLVIDRSPKAMEGPARRSLAQNEPILLQVRTEPSFSMWQQRAIQFGFEEGLTLPVGDPNHKYRGLIVIFVDKLEYFEQVGLDPFIAFSQLASVALDQSRLKISLEELVSTDPLTKLLNRRAFHEIISREYAIAKRVSRPFALLMFDLDKFKLINDNYGHDIGDQILTGVANIASQTLREADVICRWGGEEFIAFLPGTDEKGATHIAERLRDTIQNFSVDFHSQKIGTTVSIGVACFPRDGDSPDFLIKAADEALYEAKRNGRNRVVKVSAK